MSGVFSPMLEDVVRLIFCYRKQADLPCGEYPLVGVELGALRELFRVPSENPMYEVYPVGPEQAPILEAAVAQKFDFDEYDYFLDCHASTFEEPFSRRSRSKPRRSG